MLPLWGRGANLGTCTPGLKAALYVVSYLRVTQVGQESRDGSTLQALHRKKDAKM